MLCIAIRLLLTTLTLICFTDIVSLSFTKFLGVRLLVTNNNK